MTCCGTRARRTPTAWRRVGVPVVYRFEPELIHAGLNLFNSPFYPDASRRVEPIVESIARAVRAAWTTKPGRCGP